MGFRVCSQGVVILATTSQRPNRHCLKLPHVEGTCHCVTLCNARGGCDACLLHNVPLLQLRAQHDRNAAPRLTNAAPRLTDSVYQDWECWLLEYCCRPSFVAKQNNSRQESHELKTGRQGSGLQGLLHTDNGSFAPLQTLRQTAS